MHRHEGRVQAIALEQSRIFRNVRHHVQEQGRKYHHANFVGLRASGARLRVRGRDAHEQRYSHCTDGCIHTLPAVLHTEAPVITVQLPGAVTGSPLTCVRCMIRVAWGRTRHGGALCSGCPTAQGRPPAKHAPRRTPAASRSSIAVQQRLESARSSPTT